MEERNVDDAIRRHPSSLAPPERHRRFGPWGIFAAVVSVLGIATSLVIAFVANGGGHPPAHGGAVGATAPEFDLRSLDGQAEVRLSALRGRVVVVTFERPHCPECRQSEAVLDRAWRRFRHRGVAVMGIRRDVPAVGASTGPTPGPWPVLADPHGRTSDAYGVQDELETFVIDDRGKVVAALDGPVVESVLVAQLGQVLGPDASPAPAPSAAESS